MLRTLIIFWTKSKQIIDKHIKGWYWQKRERKTRKGKKVREGEKARKKERKRWSKKRKKDKTVKEAK